MLRCKNTFVRFANFQMEKLPYGHTVIQTLLVNTPENGCCGESPYALMRTILSMERRFA
jgi:hypothetical protein